MHALQLGFRQRSAVHSAVLLQWLHVRVQLPLQYLLLCSCESKSTVLWCWQLPACMGSSPQLQLPSGTLLRAFSENKNIPQHHPDDVLWLLPWLCFVLPQNTYMGNRLQIQQPVLFPVFLRPFLRQQLTQYSYRSGIQKHQFSALPMPPYLLYFLNALTIACCGRSSSSIAGICSGFRWFCPCWRITARRTASTSFAGSTFLGHRSRQAKQERHL